MTRKLSQEQEQKDNLRTNHMLLCFRMISFSDNRNESLQIRQWKIIDTKHVRLKKDILDEFI
jgi:hypothetical protein